MGYSMATPIKSAKAKKAMLLFLKKHWRAWPILIGRPKEAQYVSDPRGEDLSYDHGKCRIGFDFNAGDGERNYAWCMCAWMAIKIGRRMNHEGKQIPFFYYDGNERVRVIVDPPKTGDEKDRFDRYDDLGVLHLSKHDLCYTNRKEYPGCIGNKALTFLLKEMEKGRKKDREIIRKEIERLDGLWEKATK